jgi:hypothetical protein
MEVPDVSLELGTGAELRDDAGFDSVAPLRAFGLLLTTAAGLAAGVALFTAVPLTLLFTAGLAADFTLFLAVALAGLAMAFVAGDIFFEAGLSVFVMVFASLPVAVFSSGFLAGVAATLLLTAALLVADLVTVAFMMSFFMNCPNCPASPLNCPLLLSGRLRLYRAPHATSVRAYCQTTTSTAST